MNTAVLTANVSDQFWPTIATVIPVLALALIVEARATIERWDNDFPWIIRSVQGLGWAYVLIEFGLVEVIAFNDLTGNEKSDAWVTTAKGAIIASLATLVLTPALTIFAKANTGAAVRLLVRLRSAGAVRRHYRLWNRARRVQRRLIKREKQLEALLTQATATERKALASERPDSSERQSTLAELRADMEKIEDKLEEARAVRQEIADIRTEINKDWKEFIQKRRVFIREMDAKLSNALATTVDKEGPDEPKG